MRAVCLLLLLATPSFAIGQSPSDSAAPVATATGAYFAVSVADLDASAKWYSEKLGLRPVMRGHRVSAAASEP